MNKNNFYNMLEKLVCKFEGLMKENYVAYYKIPSQIVFRISCRICISISINIRFSIRINIQLLIF